MKLFAPALLALLLATLAGPAGAQDRRFNHDTNRWDGPEPVITVGPYVDLPPDGRAPVRKRIAVLDADRVEVTIITREPPGTVIVDTQRRRLYLVGRKGRATRYLIGVGREGFGFSGRVRVQRKAEWPDWTPPADMRARESARGRPLPVRMAGGVDNPLGARALYLYRGGRDTLFRIHGTNEPWTVGTRTSSGCIRMTNEDVVDLYRRVPNGTQVVVIGPDGRGRKTIYTEAG